MSVQNFKLVSEFQPIQRRPFGFTDPAILNPNSATPLVDGEFLELAAGYVMKRGVVDPAVMPSFAYFAERGRYETQAIQKGPFLYLGPYEADTLIMIATSIAVGDALEVSTITVGASTWVRGLQKFTSGLKVGYCTKTPASNNGFLRFIRANV